jgi:hypothetical protein
VDQRDTTYGATQPSGPAPQQPKKSARKGCGCLAGAVLFVAIVAAITVAVRGGSGNGTASAGAANTQPASDGTYTDAAALLTALDGAGLPCTAPSAVANPTVKGATSMTQCDSPDDSSGESDTVVVVFGSGPDAQTFASSMLTSGLVDANAQIVVGGSWAVNTEAPYGMQVQAKLGGTVATPPPGATTLGAAPATSATPTQTVVFTKSGSGIANIQQFTVGDDWALQYSFDCSNFGGQGNFQVYEDYPGGSVLANQLAGKGSDTSYQTADGGTHTLKVNSECSWTIKVIDGDTGQ